MAHALTNKTTHTAINISAGSTGEVVVPNPFTEAGADSARVVAVEFVADADLALDATNYATLTARDLADAVDLATGIGNQAAALTKGTAQAAAIAGAGKSLDVVRGSSIIVKKAEGGTGALIKGSVIVEWSPLRTFA